MRIALEDCKTVLDAGVGTGRFAAPLMERGFDVYGADISIPMMVKAREKGVVQVIRADVRNLPFSDDAFDSVLIVHLLHLVDDWLNVVHEVGRVARLAVLSLVGASSGFRVRQNYLKLREELGYPLLRFNEAEEGLRKVLPPQSLLLVGEYQIEVNCDAAIASLDKGDWAITWDVPRKVHERIIEKLKSEYTGKRLYRNDTFEIAVWKPQQLRNFRSLK